LAHNSIFIFKNLIYSNEIHLKYVEIELKPRFVFQNNEKQTTSVIKKTLNPTYNEVFELYNSLNFPIFFIENEQIFLLMFKAN
jgi:hypothetical protein